MTESQFNVIVEKIRKFIIIGIGIVIFVYMFHFIINKGSHELGGTTAFGAFGDYIGGILNPILGFSTVILLIFSIRLQMKELGESTQALKASQIAHEEQVKVSSGLLDEAKKANAAQLDKMRKDELRSQLTQNAEMLAKELLDLMSTQFFNDGSSTRKPLNYFLSLQRRGVGDIPSITKDFPTLMKEEKPTDSTHKIHLLEVRDKVNLAAETIIDLLPLLELGSLQTLWLERIQDLIDDCEELRIFDDDEAFTLTERLALAIKKPSPPFI